MCNRCSFFILCFTAGGLIKDFNFILDILEIWLTYLLCSAAENTAVLQEQKVKSLSNWVEDLKLQSHVTWERIFLGVKIL